MLGWTPNKGYPITGKTGHPRMQLPNQGPGKLNKLSQNAQSPVQAIPECSTNSHCMKGAAESQILRQAELY